MIGKPNPKLKQATVVGAGISGLLLAYELDRRGYEVTLIEASNRTGGLIQSRQCEFGLIESAAHSFLASPAVVELCSDLQIKLIPVRADSKARFIWRGGKMRRFPLKPWEVLQAVLRALLALAPKRTEPTELNLEQWAKRFLGAPVLDYLISPMLRGVYAARPSELAVAAAFPKLTVPLGHSLASLWVARNITRRKAKAPNAVPALAKSHATKPRPMMTPAQGMASLTEALTARLQQRLGNRFQLGRKLDRLPEGAGRDFNLALCVPASEAAKLLKDQYPALSERLEKVSYAPLITTTVFAHLDSFKKAPRGVGVLIPEKEADRRCLGILFNSSSFDSRAQSAKVASFTMMLGGTSGAELMEKSDEELRAIITREMQVVLGLQGSCEAIHMARWPRAVPKYDLDLMETWKTAHAAFDDPEIGTVLFGNYTGQVSIRGMIESLSGL